MKKNNQNNDIFCVRCRHRVIRFGFKNGIQRFRCKLCEITFSEFNPLPMNQIPKEKREYAKELLGAGLSLRAVASAVGIHKTTVFNLKHGRTHKAQPSQKGPGVGLCECGCGQYTTATAQNDVARGLKRGEYSRFIKGHWHNLKRKENPRWGSQYQRLRQRDDVRQKLVQRLRQNGSPLTLEELRREFGYEFRMEGLSRMLNYARSLSKFGLFPKVPDTIVRYKHQVKPPYERPEIPYEQETEITLLTNQRFFTSLDDTPFEGSCTLHEIVRSNTATPLDMLIEKEEAQSWESIQRKRDIEAFDNYQYVRGNWKEICPEVAFVRKVN